MTTHRLQCRIRCNVCDEGFKSQAALIKHVQDVHTIKEHVCDICQAAFDKPHKLAYHRIDAHQDEFPWKCNQCDGAFGRQDVLKRHAVTVHNDDDDEFYNCYTCGMQVRRRDSWQRHIKNCQMQQEQQP